MDVRKLSDPALRERCTTLVARDRLTTAELLDCIAEVDARKLYLADGYPSLFAWCVAAHRMSESTAAMRIQAARAARRFAGVLRAVAEGRLHLSAVCILAPHLRAENAAELVEAGSGLARRELEAWLAVRFAPSILQQAACSSPAVEPGPLAALPPSCEPTAGESYQPPPVEVDHSPRVPSEPLRPGSPALVPHSVLTIALPPAVREKFDRAKCLLARVAPAGDLGAEVLDRALDLLIAQEERRQFAAVGRPRTKPATRRQTLRARTVPAEVRRAVIARDGRQCSYRAPDGRRCSARSRLEFDHVVPLSRGGTATAENTRVLCDRHNQYEAERVLGREFMRRKRAEAKAGNPARASQAAGPP